jgi:SAM-dependent methyltransferase
MPDADHDNLQSVLDEERDLMNFYAPHYRSSMLFNNYYYQQERRLFVDWILQTVRESGGDPEAMSYLDVGSATGEILQLLSASGCARLTGIDIAEQMLSESNHRPIPGVRLIHGAIEQHDFGDDRFDVITSCLTVHHMFDQAAFFRAVDRILVPGGWFFVLEYNGAGWGHLPWTGKPLEWLLVPLRRAIKIKNRAVLTRLPPIPPRFNHAHKLLSYRDILDAVPGPARYRVMRYTRGLVLPVFKNALIRGSVVDAALYRVTDILDNVVKPFGAGYIQGIAGRRVG